MIMLCDFCRKEAEWIVQFPTLSIFTWYGESQYPVFCGRHANDERIVARYQVSPLVRINSLEARESLTHRLAEELTS